MVAISASTLNALKNWLFSDEQGINLKNVIDDMAGTEESSDRDITAINVALAFKGVPVDIDKSTRYGGKNTYNKTYQSYTFERYSLILDRVYYTIRVHKYIEQTESADGIVPCHWELNYEFKDSCSLEDWYCKKTSNEEFIKAFDPTYIPSQEETAE